ncbi:MAG: NUDIX domain-containing protein [Clostridiales bacterium]|jgi:ADP-ribose pyrophosphatase YjhB (NUDIX family)|nr:NUDIX domain-containing protein [Clostridiales bacterium]
MIDGCGVIVRKGGKILAGRRTDGQGWCGGGGHVEPGETARQAARRELKEEFGVDALLRPLGAVCGAVGGEAYISHIFLAEGCAGEPKARRGEIEEWMWASPRDLRRLELFPPFAKSLRLLPPEPGRGETGACAGAAAGGIMDARDYRPDQLRERGRFASEGREGGGNSPKAPAPSKTVAERAEELNALPDRDSESHDAERQSLLDDMLASGSAPERRSLAEISDAIYDTGGFTYDLNAGETKHVGFSVAIEGHERAVRIKELTQEQRHEALRNYAKDNIGALTQPSNHFGGWLNPEDGVLYLDVSRVTNDVKEARRNAVNANQEAFYDFQTGQSVFTVKGAAQERTKSGENS